MATVNFFVSLDRSLSLCQHQIYARKFDYSEAEDSVAMICLKELVVCLVCLGERVIGKRISIRVLV